MPLTKVEQPRYNITNSRT